MQIKYLYFFHFPCVPSVKLVSHVKIHKKCWRKCWKHVKRLFQDFLSGQMFDWISTMMWLMHKIINIIIKVNVTALGYIHSFFTYVRWKWLNMSSRQRCMHPLNMGKRVHWFQIVLNIGRCHEWRYQNRYQERKKVGSVHPYWCVGVSLAHQFDSDKFASVLLHHLVPPWCVFLLPPANLHWTLGVDWKGLGVIM